MTGWCKIKNTYFRLLPFVYLPCVNFSICTGLTKEIEKKYEKTHYKVSNLDVLSSLIGYTTIGIVTAVTYPVSFPLMGLYFFSNSDFKFYKKENQI